MDDVDRAQHEETAYRQSAITAALPGTDGVGQHRENGVIVCWDCGVPIPRARLEVLPTACRCVECQQDAEARPC